MTERISGIFFSSDFLEANYGDQDCFKIRSEEAVRAGLDLIRSKDPTTGFYSLYTMLADRRRAIAMEQDSKDKEDFGRIRSREEDERCSFAYTELTGVYQEVGNTALKRLTSLMTKMMEKGKDLFSQEIWGRKWTLRVDILGPNPQGHFSQIAIHPASFPPYMRPCFLENGNFRLDNVEAFSRLHREDSEIFGRLDVSDFIRQAELSYPSERRGAQNRKSEYVWTTLSMDIDGVDIPLVTYATWMDRKSGEPFIERMKKYSVIFVRHQVRFNHKITIVALSRLWGRIVTWKERGEPIDRLQNDVAHFRFIFALAMLSYRGDGAIGDWLEEIAYKINGLVFTPAEKTLLPFEPFAAVIPSFYEKDYFKTRSWNP